MLFALLTLLSALSLAAVAGWFSIVGFMAIYAGAPMYALIMGVVTECAKLVTTSWLYRNWQHAGWGLKAPLLYFTLALMTATSIGVFGFLSKAHIEQGADKIDNSAKIENLNYQINREKGIITDNEKVIGQLDATVNSLLGKDRADRALSVRKSQASQRKQLQEDSAAAQKRIDELSKEKFTLESEVRKLQLDVGPIRYIAELIYGVDGDGNKNIEAAVRIFTLLIVSTLDPLAVILLIAANHTLIRIRREKEEKDTPGKERPSFFSRFRKKEDSEAVDQTLQENGKDRPGDEILPSQRFAEEETKVYSEVPQEAPKVSVDEEKEELDNIHPAVSENHEPSQSDVDETTLEGGEITEIRSEEANTESEAHPSEEDSEIQEKVPQSLIDEIKNTTLEKLLAAGRSSPVTVLRSPRITSVSKQEDPAPEPIVSKVEDEVQTDDHPLQPMTPWAQQEPVLRELLGSSAHFVPVKLHEEIKPHKMERREEPEENKVNASGTTSGGFSPSPSVEEVHTQSQEEAKDKNENEELAAEGAGNAGQVSQANSYTGDKYPKALSWINEFRGN